MYPVTTTAWHFPIEVSEVPASVDIIGGDALDPARSTTLVDVLRREANINFRSYSGSPLQAEINLRGFGSISNQRVLVLVDGVPLNPPDMSGFNWLEIPTSLVESIEVLRGSQTTLYGNHAVGGVINITTQQAPAEPFLEATAYAGSDGLWNAQMTGGQSFGGLSVFAVAQHFEEDGYRDHTSQDADTLHLALHYTPNNNAWQASGRITWVDSYNENAGPLTDDRYYADPRQSAGGQVEANQTYWSAQGNWNRAVGDWRMDVNGGYTHKLVRSAPAGLYSDDTYQIATLNPRVLREDAGGESILGLDFGGNWLEVEHYQADAREVLIGHDDVSLSTAALYVHRRQDLSDDWQLSGGLRGEVARYDFDEVKYDPFDPDYSQGTTYGADRDLDGWSANLGLVWQPSDHFRQWLRADRLYRYPALDEAFSYRGYPQFNNDLDPEEGYNVELGGEWRQEHLTLRLNGFVQWIEGEIDYLGSKNTNLPDTRRWGIESTARWDGRWWGAQLDYTWLQAQFIEGTFDGNDRYLVPNHQLTLSADLRPLEQLNLGASYRYTSGAYEGDDFANNQPKLPPNAVVDVYADWQPLESLSLFASCDNVFDNHYATVKYSGAWYPAPGRTWRAGAKYTF